MNERLEKLLSVLPRQPREIKYKSKVSTDSSKFIDELGGNVVAKNIFKVSSEVISQWRRNGIPEDRLDKLELYLLRQGQL